MSAQDSKLEIARMIEEVEYAVTTLSEIEAKLDSLEGSALLLGLTSSNNRMAAGIVQVIEAAKHNRETLWRFLFNIKNRLMTYNDVL